MKPRNSKTGQYAKIKNPKSEMMRLTVEEKELILKNRKNRKNREKGVKYHWEKMR